MSWIKCISNISWWINATWQVYRFLYFGGLFLQFRDFFMDYTYDEEDNEDDDDDVDLSVQPAFIDLLINQTESKVHSVDDDDPFHLGELVNATLNPSSPAAASDSQSTVPHPPSQPASPSSSSARTRVPRPSLSRTNSSLSPLPLSRRLLSHNPSHTHEDSTVRLVCDRRARTNQKRLPRLTLVTDCCHPHDLDPISDRYLVLQVCRGRRVLRCNRLAWKSWICKIVYCKRLSHFCPRRNWTF